MASSVFIWPGDITFTGAISFSGNVTVGGTLGVTGATTFSSTATFGNYVVNSGPFVTASGERWLHSEAGGGGGSVYENTCFGYDAGKALVGTCYANTLIGKSAGLVLNGTAPAATSNTMVGYGSGIAVTTGAFNTLMGAASGSNIVTQSGLTYLGYHAGERTTGTGNTYVGQFAGRGAASVATGISNTAVGDSALTAHTGADSCAAFGISALEVCTSGDNNTAIGSFALRAITTTSGSIGLGYFAGAFETGAGKFFVNNQSRTNEAGDRTQSLIYGVMDASVANQSITFNAASIGMGSFVSGSRTTSQARQSITTAVTLSGASSSTGNVIPAGATVLGVSTTTTTAITGASGYTVGDGSDADRYGDITGTALGTSSGSANYTADPRWWTNAARAIVLTAKTSNFTAGVVQVTVFYRAESAA